MKKMIRILVFLIILLGLIGCSNSLSVSSKYAQYNLELENKMKELLIPEKITRFEVVDLLGGPSAMINLANGITRTSYYNGGFFVYNTEENRKILKDYITDYFLEDEERFKDIALAIYFKKNEEKNEEYIYSLKIEQLRRF